MPTIGWFEILLIVAVAIIVVGPKDFPVMLKKVGSWIGSIKKYISEIQNEITTFENETNDSFDPDLEKNLEDKKNDKI